MRIIRRSADMIHWSREIIAAGNSVALVPTMGYFHEGHLSLMRKAATLAEHVVVSLFVNSLQFGPQEDLGTYPRDFERDSRMAADESVDVLFAPTDEEMYASDFSSRVIVEGLTHTLCGRQRPGHFEGVTTVVAKLFNIVKPRYAVFGQKDFQQLTVIRKMVRDLNWDIDIIGHPIVREHDGLAMSSRNTYLSEKERADALCLYSALVHARARFRAGLTDTEQLKNEVRDIICATPGVSIDYISVVDKDMLQERTKLDMNSVLVLAVRLGRTRLIDNCYLGNVPHQANDKDDK